MTADGAARASNSIVYQDVVSPFCAGACDDNRLTVEDNRIVAAEGRCSVACQSFLSSMVNAGPDALIDGRPATLDDALLHVGELLRSARAPLIFGLEHLTCEAQSLAVTLADRLGATIDTPASALAGTRGTSIQSVGEATCTLGELSERADFLVLWDVFSGHVPCQVRRDLLDHTASGSPAGRRVRRKMIHVEEARRGSASEDPAEVALMKESAQAVLSIGEHESLNAFSVLRAILKGLPLEATSVLAQTAVPLEQWEGLVEQMQQCRYGVIVLTTYDAEVERAANQFVYELNDRFRFALVTINKSGMNSVGAENVLAWRTGYPCAVTFAAGFPRYSPGEYSASKVLDRCEADLAVLFGYPHDIELDALETFAERFPVVLIADASNEAVKPAVFVRTAKPGLHVAGTIFRFDGVPLPLRAIVNSPLPATEEVLALLLNGIDQDKMPHAKAPRRKKNK